MADTELKCFAAAMRQQDLLSDLEVMDDQDLAASFGHIPDLYAMTQLGQRYRSIAIDVFRQRYATKWFDPHCMMQRLDRMYFGQ